MEISFAVANCCDRLFPLSAYTADEGDFEEVMRAYIAELNTKIDLLQIDVERLQVLARLDYLLAGSAINEE